MTRGFRDCSFGFTLLELLVVMGIMIVMMGMGITGYIAIRRGAELRGAVSSVRTTLMLARQQAITKRRTVTVSFRGGTNAATMAATYYMRITEKISETDVNAVHADAFLPMGIEFQNGELPASITFYPSGRAGDLDPRDITVQEKFSQRAGDQYKQSATVRVWPLTGVTRVTEP
jgi:Tfp pilus assembly protein FimT